MGSAEVYTTGSFATFREGVTQNVTVNVNSGAMTTITNAFGSQTKAIRINCAGIVTATAGVRYTIGDAKLATGTLLFGANPTDGDTVVLGSSTYRFKTTMALAGDVKLEATAAATLAHLVNTINNTGAAGTDYFAGTTVPNASAKAAISGTSMIATALALGTGGNSITSTQTITGGLDTWSGTTLSGGSGPTAGATSSYLPLNWVEYCIVTPGQGIAVLSNDNTFSGTLSVTELQ